jgi:hypothetical protein
MEGGDGGIIHAEGVRGGFTSSAPEARGSNDGWDLIVE